MHRLCALRIGRITSHTCPKARTDTLASLVLAAKKMTTRRGTKDGDEAYFPFFSLDACTDSLDPNDCDTLEDSVMNDEERASISACYACVCKHACEQPGTTGVLLVGPLELTRSVAHSWCLEVVAAPARRSSSPRPDNGDATDDTGAAKRPDCVYASITRVKSWPRGRMGKPLADNEVRHVCVLVRTREGPVVVVDREAQEAPPEMAQLCTLVLWHRPQTGANRGALPHAASPHTLGQTTELELCAGARSVYGIGCVGIHQFCHHGRHLLEAQKLTHGRCQYHCVLGSAIGVVRDATTPDGHATMVSDTIHHVVLAAAIHGTPLHDLPARRPPMRVLTLDVLQAKQRESMQGLIRLCCQTTGASDAAARAEEEARHLEADAVAVSERLSMRGLMHLLAVVGRVHVPDGLWQCKSNSIGLVTALAVRIALFPRAVGLDEGDCPHEALAREETKQAMEAVVPGLHTHKKIVEEPQFTIDASIRTAMQSVTRALSTEPPPRNAQVETCEMDAAIHESLRCLQSFGMSLVLDAFGAPGRLTRDLLEQSESVANEVDLARQRHARRVTRGECDAPPPPAFFIPGRATRSALQHALLAHLAHVEQSLAPRASLDHWAAAVQRAAAANGGEGGEGGDAQPPSPPPVQQQPNGVAVAVAVPVGQRVVDASRPSSSKRSKKKKTDRKRGAPQPPASKPRPSASCFSSSSSSSSSAAPCSTIDTSAAVAAAECLEDVLELGSVAGLTHLTEPRAFLVTPSMQHECGRCACPTHVVASLGFAGSFGACRGCHAPLCTDCAQLALLAASANQSRALVQLSCCTRCLQSAMVAACA